jgi:hypothetical protein
MKLNLALAVAALANEESGWTMIGIEYSGLKWDENNVQPKPTEEECIAKLSELNSEESMRLLRIERDKRLADVDWKVIREVSQTNSISDNLKNYMQALRDLPTTASPTLDDNWELDHSSIDWPTLEE